MHFRNAPARPAGIAGGQFPPVPRNPHSRHGLDESIVDTAMPQPTLAEQEHAELDAFVVRRVRLIELRTAE
ncbi:MAG: hypothetical protein WD066_08855 [Planctomycetaceae bacterium]